ncbi:MAG: NapC/NirT family cytochrome c, partial [Deltaproteobacteria bacterium]|nr:NapC/NirT family cytochrome c [Deltaproteobacteria bacterium]
MGIFDRSKILRFSARLIFLAAALLGVVYAATMADRALSLNAVCTFCHSMSYTAAELKRSPHYGTLGVDPGCADCHLPQGFSGRAKV